MCVIVGGFVGNLCIFSKIFVVVGVGLRGVLARIGDQSFGFCRGKSVLDRLVLLVSLMGQWQLVLFGGKILSGFV